MFAQMEIAGTLSLRSRLEMRGENTWDLEFGNIVGTALNVPDEFTEDDVCNVFHAMLDKAIILESKGEGYEGLCKACVEVARIMGRRPPKGARIAVYRRIYK